MTALRQIVSSAKIQPCGAAAVHRWQHPPLRTWTPPGGCTPEISPPWTPTAVAHRGPQQGHVICGGENIYPREIEELLYRHTAIQDVQVIGVPDAKYGEETCAWMVLKSIEALSDEAVVSSLT